MYEATPTSPIIAGILEGNDNLDVGSSFMSIFENNSSLYDGVENLGIEPAFVGFLRDECEAQEMCDFGGDGVILNPHPISFASITNVRDATTFMTLLEEEGDLHVQGALGTSANTINCLETHVHANGEDEVIDNGLMGQCNGSLIGNTSDQQQRQEGESFNVVDATPAVGIPLHKSFNSTVVEAGGYDHLTFLEKDCRNYVEQVRRVKICAGEAMAIQAYFQKLQAQCDGMSSTQRSESMNAFFDGYVHSKTTLMQFVEQYERALRNKCEKEFLADSISFAKTLPCASAYPIEKQLQTVYTISKFQEFKTEMIGKMYCHIMSHENGSLYTVGEDVIGEGFHKRKNFKVEFDRETNFAKCECHLFEFRGTICRHCLCVLIQNDVKVLSETYILSRWRRDIKRTYTVVRMEYDGLPRTVEQRRYDMLCAKFQEFAQIAADDEERTKDIVAWIDKQLLIPSLRKASEERIPENMELDKTLTKAILDPTYSKRKGAPKKNRLKSVFENKNRKRKQDKKIRHDNDKKKSSEQRKVNKSKRGNPDQSSTTLFTSVGDIGCENMPTWDWPGEDVVYDLTCLNLDLRL
ncbi:unnamed protein product [Cuscuta campestris]|uniref:Protein FAR1-RELATED SEQUENCE n=1 Tax=Cuscuta campestris TaxID=132261 RepID=A0A484L1L9_9ASTE|nr:unnamed protein product [Cuscuta campestris]